MKTISNPKYQRIINNLIKARDKSNLKQIDIAKKLKRPQSYISRVESGEYRIDIIELLEFCKIYRAKLDDLLK